MIKVVAAVALTAGLASYAVAQEVAPRAGDFPTYIFRESRIGKGHHGIIMLAFEPFQRAMSVRQGSRVLFRIHKLANLGALLIKIRQVLLSQALINLEFLLGAIFLASSYIRLAQTIVNVRQVRIQFACP